jgi:hypothetical protein
VDEASFGRHRARPRNPAQAPLHLKSEKFTADFTEASIGAALATRALMADLRAMGEVAGGPKPMAPRDRSRFLSALDEAVVRQRRQMPPSAARRS